MDYPQGQDINDLATLQLTYDRLLQQTQHQASFLGTASHELRSPINQIISLHQLILEDLCESPAEEREFIAQANQAIQTVLKNLDLLITLSKLDMGSLQRQLSPTALEPRHTAPLGSLIPEVFVSIEQPLRLPIDRGPRPVLGRDFS